MSFVTVACSSIAVAMAETMSPTSLTTRVILSISEIALPVALCIPAIFLRISPVADAVCSARVLISFATTANPFPAAPARAASIVALSARRFVCAEMLVIVSVTVLIS